MARIRLQKLLAECGHGSRRACEEIIAMGRVTVDREVVTTPGTQVDPDDQDVRCDGQKVRPPVRRYYLLNKPRGVICSAKGLQGKPKAIDFVPAEARADRLFTVGRLDVDSEGALLLTNDGELCHKVTHPRFGVEKAYRVEVDGFADDETILRMRKGVWLAEGRTSSLKIRMIARRPDRTVLDMTLNEGMKREIRRVCARFGHEVRRLVRVAVGPIRLEGLPVGAVRELTSEEITALTDSAEVVIKLGSAGHSSKRPARARRAAPVEGRRTFVARDDDDARDASRGSRASRPGGGDFDSDARPARRSFGKTDGRTSGKSVGKPDGRTSGKSFGKPGGRSSDKSGGRSSGKPGGKPSGKFGGKPRASGKPKGYGGPRGKA